MDRRQLSRVHAALDARGKGLGDKAYCTGIHLNLADIAVGVSLGYLDFRFAEIDWRTPYPRLGVLYEKLMQRPSFVETKPPG